MCFLIAHCAVSGQSAVVATHYIYDADNRLLRVTGWATGTTTYGYDAVGQLITTMLPNGVVLAREYDAAGQLTALTHRQADGTLLATYRYELDGLGNATRVTETLADAGYNRVEYVRQSAGNCDQCCTYHDNSQSVATQDLASLPPHRNAKAQKLPS